MAGGNGKRPAYRVVLMGGKPLAIQALDELQGMPGVEVVAVVPCADDDGRSERWPSLAAHARDRGLAVHQPRSANDESFLPVLHQLRPDVLLPVFYDKILKPHVLSLPSIAAVNVHFGLLPDNRGSQPIPWALIDGNEPGVTMYYLDPGVDTGDIVAQLAVPPSGCETARDVYERCTAAGRYLIERYLPLVLQGRAPRRRQAAGGSYYRPGDPFDRWIDWSQSADVVSRFVRALTFPPFPGARASFAGRELEVCHPVWPSEGARVGPGSVVSIGEGAVEVATGQGLLTIRTARLDGEELSAGDALRRLSCREGSMLEGMPWMRRLAAA